jgi:nicotinamide riboside transporter PnuC
MVPIALLTAFSGASYGGKKEVTNYVLILSFLMLGLYLFTGLSFLSSVLYVVFFNIALGMYCLQYDRQEESPTANNQEEPAAELTPQGE